MAGCTIGIVSQIASLCKVGQRLINLTDFCIISFHGVFQSKRVGLRTRIMWNLKLHFSKPQSQDEIKSNQPPCAAVLGQSHSSLCHTSRAGLQSGGAPASVWALLQHHWHQGKGSPPFHPSLKVTPESFHRLLHSSPTQPRATLRLHCYTRLLQTHRLLRLQE